MPKLSSEERQALEDRLEKLQRHQEIYNRRGHDQTPVDEEIAEITAKLKTGGQVKPSEDK